MSADRQLASDLAKLIDLSEVALVVESKFGGTEMVLERDGLYFRVLIGEMDGR